MKLHPWYLRQKSLRFQHYKNSTIESPRAVTNTEIFYNKIKFHSFETNYPCLSLNHYPWLLQKPGVAMKSIQTTNKNQSNLTLSQAFWSYTITWHIHFQFIGVAETSGCRFSEGSFYTVPIIYLLKCNFHLSLGYTGSLCWLWR